MKNDYLIRLEVEDGKVDDILQRLEKAQETIRDCYYELRELGFLVIRKADDRMADGFEGD